MARGTVVEQSLKFDHDSLQYWHATWGDDHVYAATGTHCDLVGGSGFCS
ncbi:hypothetical protein HN358_01940 [Candidatus Uhrbacteria bacterium]|nr:hypothetical protein [Candidatus Uhrbacteria bacterium]MBT7716866.1 hypothetical protein [Candidatus Uhrbacteria bacterium]